MAPKPAKAHLMLDRSLLHTRSQGDGWHSMREYRLQRVNIQLDT